MNKKDYVIVTSKRLLEKETAMRGDNASEQKKQEFRDARKEWRGAVEALNKQEEKNPAQG